MDYTAEAKTAFNDRSLAYAPDVITGPMIAKAIELAPQYYEPDTQDSPHPASSMDRTRRFSLEESKELIISALDHFSPELGEQARRIMQTACYNGGASDRERELRFAAMPYDGSPLDDPNHFLSKDYKLEIEAGKRWNLTPAAPGQCRLMRCLPAESNQQECAPGAYDPANPHPYAVIEYQFDGTLDGVIYMAHETGHAIADDYQREAGMTYRDNPRHLPEMQAYLVQHIVYDHLKQHDDPSVSSAAQRHFETTMQHNIAGLRHDQTMYGRPMSILTSLGLYNHLVPQDGDARKTVSEALLGRSGPKNINEVIAASGIKISDLSRSAIKASISPNERPAALVIDVQDFYGMAPADAQDYADKLSQTLNELRSQDPPVPVMWATMAEGAKLYAPREDFAKGPAPGRNMDEMIEMGFHGVNPDPELQKQGVDSNIEVFRKFIAEYGPKVNETVVRKSVKSALLEKSDIEGKENYSERLATEECGQPAHGYFDLAGKTLADHFRSLNINRIIIMGAISAHCIAETSASAAIKEFNPEIPVDLVLSRLRDNDRESHPIWRGGMKANAEKWDDWHRGKIETALSHISADTDRQFSADDTAALKRIKFTTSNRLTGSFTQDAAVRPAPSHPDDPGTGAVQPLRHT